MTHARVFPVSAQMCHGPVVIRVYRSIGGHAPYLTYSSAVEDLRRRIRLKRWYGAAAVGPHREAPGAIHRGRRRTGEGLSACRPVAAVRKNVDDHRADLSAFFRTAAQCWPSRRRNSLACIDRPGRRVKIVFLRSRCGRPPRVALLCVSHERVGRSLHYAVPVRIKD